MPRGGVRVGAGRPKGSANRASRERAEAVAASGMVPLDYLLSVMRDPEADTQQRLDAAKAAAPYVHAKLSTVEAKVDVSGALAVTRVELVGLEAG